MTPRRVLLLGAESSAAEDLVEAAHGLGAAVHLATHEDVRHTYPASLTERLEAVVCTDFRAPQAALEELAHYCAEQRITGVVAGWEFLSPVATRLAHRLGLPGHDPERAEAARNKWLMARAFAEHGVPAARSLAASSSESAEARIKAAGLDFPLVVKPAENAGSVGVAVIGSFDELPAAFRAARRWTNEFPYGIPLDTTVLVQEYLHGPEFSVESVVVDGHARHLAITQKFTTDGGLREETGHTVPAALDEATRFRAQEVVAQALRALGLRHGVAHTELKVTPEGPRIIEVGARPPGGHIMKVVEQATGVSEARAYLQVALGLRPDVDAVRQDAAAIRFLGTERRGSFSGFSAVPDEPEVVEVRAYLEPGQQVGSEHERYARVGHVLVRAASAVEANRTADAAAAAVRIGVRD